MKSNEYKRDVYPLAPTGKMNGQRYNVYTDRLKEAINHPDIYNIAITGDTGIGKTSVIKSYTKDSKHKFASLSLAEYNTEYHMVKDGGSREKTKEDNDKTTKERLEKSMLRQIISLCRHKDIPYSSLEIVPEEPNRFIAITKGFLIAVYAIMWLIELNSERVSEYIHSWLKTNNHEVSLYFFKIKNAFLTAEGALSTAIESSAVSLINSRVLITGYGRIGKALAKYLSVFTRNITVFARKEKDRADAICNSFNAIVFEDMDRIDDGIAIEILTYLREINTSVNKRIQLRHRFFKKKLCFIFVINEDMVSKFDYHKYIDYGLSIIPTLSQANAMDSVDLLLKNLPGFEEYENINCENAVYSMLIDLFVVKFSKSRMITSCFTAHYSMVTMLHQNSFRSVMKSIFCPS